MKKILSLAVLAAMSTASMAATMDNTNWYAGLVVGSTKFKALDGSENKTNFGANLGYALNENVAFELQAQRLGSWSDSDGSLKVSTVNLSVLAGAPISDGIKLFARFGYARNTLKASLDGYSATDHANKAIVGVGADFKVASNVSLRTEYSYLGSNTVGSGANSIDVKISQFNVGVNFAF